MAADPGLRLTTATAMTACTALRISRPEFLRVMREEQSFSYLFSSFLLACSLRTQADLVDQLFNPAEKRLARVLLLLAEYSQPGEEEYADSADLAGSAGQYDREYTPSRERIHEPLSQTRVH